MVQTPQRPPKVTDRPKEAWGTRRKKKEGTDKIFAAKRNKKNLANILPETEAQKQAQLLKSMRQKIPVCAHSSTKEKGRDRQDIRSQTKSKKN